MIVEVEMLAFMGNDFIRIVDIPDEEYDTAEKLSVPVYYWGQNDFQPRPQRCSVSAGDVFPFKDKKHLFLSFGICQLSDTEYQEYRSIDRRERLFWRMELEAKLGRELALAAEIVNSVKTIKGLS